MIFLRQVWFYVLYRVIMRWFLKVFVGVEFDRDLPSISSDEAYIVIANHNSHMDTMVILCSLPFSMQGRVYPVAAADYFAKSKIKKFLYSLFVNAVYVERSPKRNHVHEFIANMAKKIDSGSCLLIYPEGSRGEPGVLGEFKSGAARVLLNSRHLNYVPVYLHETWKPLPKGDGLLIPYLSRVLVGPMKEIDKSKDHRDIALSMREDVLSLKPLDN